MTRSEQIRRLVRWENECIIELMRLDVEDEESIPPVLRLKIDMTHAAARAFDEARKVKRG